MSIDEKDFFYEVTARICGSLKIEVALKNAFEYISKHVPVEEVYVGINDPYKKVFRIMARADSTTGEMLNLQYPVNEEIGTILKNFEQKNVPTITMERSYDIVTATFFSRKILEGDSCLLVPLNLGVSLRGVLIFFSKGLNVFSKHDLQLLSLIAMPFAMSVANARKYLELIRIREQLIAENRQLKEKIKETATRIIGRDTGLKNVFRMIELVASLDVPVLLLGETGVGKEIIADEIHARSTRYNAPFVKVNCGALSPSLLDSELFGYEKGAFTGADKKTIGKFERANNGTIFLDEIGELTAEAQVRLLRVLEQQTIERLGGSETISLSIRMIFATNRNLERMVKRREFREDLYFRLNLFPITIPALRERKEDIPSFVYYFLGNKAQELGLGEIPTISNEDFARMAAYNWPGNIRELQNIVERAMIVGRNEDAYDFSRFLPLVEANTLQNNQSQFKALNENISEHIQKALLKTNGKISGPGGAAELLGMNASTLRSRIKKLGIGANTD